VAHPVIALLLLLLAAGSLDEKALRERINSTFSVSRPALEAASHGQFEPEPGIVADRISYATEFGTRVPAIVYHPKDMSLRRPALIVVNGHGGDKYSWYSFYSGILYARAGAVVLTYDPAGEGERNKAKKSGSRQHDIVQQPEEPMGRRMAGLMITDIEQAVTYLSQRPDVDPKRIATMGYSMGSFINSLACAVETRLHSCVMVGGGNLDGPDGYWDSSSKKMCQSYPYKALSFLGDRPAVIYALQADHATTFVFNGREDEVVAIPSHLDGFFKDLHDRTAKLHGSAKNVFEFDFNPTGSHRPYFVTRPVALWLEKQLRFPNWTEAKVKALGETHISEWAAKNNVFVDKAYATEAREGGAMALDTGIPPVAHQALNVFSETEWNAAKDKLILDNWWTAARNAIQP
jgi:dienelactone hydrolase